MNRATQLEHRTSSRLGKHEGEPSFALCDRLDRTRANSQRQLPTDHDYAVPTREYQTDQSSLKPAQAAARSVLAKEQLQKQTHRSCGIDRVTPYQGNALIQSRFDSDNAVVAIWPYKPDDSPTMRVGVDAGPFGLVTKCAQMPGYTFKSKAKLTQHSYHP